jgi:hypothetical protein
LSRKKISRFSFSSIIWRGLWRYFPPHFIVLFQKKDLRRCPFFSRPSQQNFFSPPVLSNELVAVLQEHMHVWGGILETIEPLLIVGEPGSPVS